MAGLVAELQPAAVAAPTPDAKLVDLGLDSLACADLAGALEQRFNVRLADNDVTGHSTVAEVAATVRREMPAGARIPERIGRHQQLGKALGAGWWRRTHFATRTGVGQHEVRNGTENIRADITDGARAGGRLHAASVPRHQARRQPPTRIWGNRQPGYAGSWPRPTGLHNPCAAW